MFYVVHVPLPVRFIITLSFALPLLKYVPFHQSP
jgi:hypothetical protein